MNDRSDPAADLQPANGNDPEAGLLPAGLRDVLPPRAEWEATVSERLLGCFAAQGYARVKPPLIEFEETLLAGPGQAMAGQMFRVMDPVSQRMMGVRNDITVQVARLARTRMLSAPRPLRLSYGGQVLRVRGTQLRPERQFAQAGFELIGSAAPAADAEVALLAVQSVRALGVPNLSLDLTHPLLVPAICQALGMPAALAAKVREALDRKDAAALAALDGKSAPLLQKLLAASGPADAVMAKLAELDLPASARAMIDQLAVLVAEVKAAAPDLLVTVDPAEYRSFEYHTGISFSLFARNVRGELGRGGRYLVGDAEPATGCTLYLDSLMRALPAPEQKPLLYLPFGTPHAAAMALRDKGWSTLLELEAVADHAGAAKRQGCTHYLVDGKVAPLG